ncbi:MAG TPA: hypothetical protein PKW33_07480 [Anaerolineaceae bacterium]|nr:hypothetical protein [Anaerolineaceae bacterium]HPN51413.1 hypothetical protein [Anaerolineaceae bacterium]
MSKKNLPILLAVCALMMAMLACSLFGGSTPAPTKAPEKPAATEASPEKEPTKAQQQDEATKVPAPTKAPEQAPTGGEEMDVANINEGLDSLSSYRMYMLMKVDGVDKDGNPAKGEIEITNEVISGSKDSRLSMVIKGDILKDAQAMGGHIEMVRVGDTQYMLFGDVGAEATCMNFPADDSTTNETPINPNDMFGDLKKVKLVARGETVNGIVSDHYKVDSNSLSGNDTFTDGEGDIWLAQDGKYVVKFTGSGTGDIDLMDTGTKSKTKIDWIYELQDINQVTAITAPECKGAGGATDIPVPDNATEVSNLGGLMTFKSADNVKTLAEFYKTKLPENGWKADGDPTELDTMAILNYTKDNRKLSVMITKEDAGGSSVLITDTTK